MNLNENNAYTVATCSLTTLRHRHVQKERAMFRNVPCMLRASLISPPPRVHLSRAAGDERLHRKLDRAVVRKQCLGVGVAVAKAHFLEVIERGGPFLVERSEGRRRRIGVAIVLL